jgi:vitamin K-dependent gamma-carboxylase-like protein
LKLAGDEWIDGTALYYVSRLDDFFGRFPIPAWLFDTPWVVAPMTWGVLIVELAVPMLIWFKETRRWCLLATVLFHLANEWTMHLFLFHWIMLVGWLSFLTTDDLTWVTRGCRPGGKQQRQPAEKQQRQPAEKQQRQPAEKQQGAAA